MTLWMALFIGILVLAGILWWMFRPRAPRLSAASKQKLRLDWQRACSHTDAHRKLLDADAVLSHLFKALGYEGSMGEQLKSAQAYIPDIDAVWTAHKLRNRIAHEPGTVLFPNQVEQAMKAFGRVIEKFC